MPEHLVTASHTTHDETVSGEVRKEQVDADVDSSTANAGRAGAASKAAIGLRVTVSAATKVKERRRDAERLPRRLWWRTGRRKWARPTTRWALGGRAEEEA